MGLYLFNLSADTADPHPAHIPEDLSINDQESIIEIFVEKILGYEDAIKEYDGADTEEHNKKTTISIDLFVPHTVESGFNHSLFETTKENLPDHNAYLANGFQKLDTPPPKI
ncbi:hypothetical protein SYJ56_20505 [Algoriphagus sp. D3-2-R+10]|uniref:hypothetical protein n=1 Tax=Algoriphagus aurantiacus TaxID=3103948 RepID=UPI002B3809DA|nr:hypothetical protein [Algoriphagus sp. D3-2-R+10]MEB2777709.1 hypothetical protein [Algoriphagus sp. D3-2-R+10]